ncbi:pseudouridylate synthase 4 [Coprinopsis cinerea okayama7|uniref:tRNA pseudouridine(55) synthase n=1 Tax=Coprinopsis cinerea (strain Okayama-7 / 130 / ATCC MYA-4618 / FGSC 9003) TaxID=240176 RepID=A8NFA9_COPC7|nr:pseudouridylate synthase 4 [Coprinopsis cinerea okayama7\|eukprot:XP_001833239.1 pseudouridylate synthase 4 [Coprinopsis cinerea okayama7\
MPKVLSKFPVSGLFGVLKPSGPTSMSVVHDLQELVTRSKLFVLPDKLEQMRKRKPAKRKGKPSKDAVKVGQGGTLDPLADGVLVIGVGKGTKKLSEFLDCTKEYETTCLLGCETDTYDSEGSRVRLAPWHHVTPELVKSMLPKFTGEISQTPPIFSALKMDGKPLYEYARKGIPLPRPIEPRKVTIHSLELVEWKGKEHTYRWPEKTFSEDDKRAMETALKSVDASVEIKDDPDLPSEQEAPTAFVLKMRVSGGTYVRSIVHDLAHAVGSAGHVVTLSRTRQGRFVTTPTEGGDRACIPWEVFEKASEDEEPDADGWKKWEREVMDHLEVIEEHGPGGKS